MSEIKYHEKCLQAISEYTEKVFRELGGELNNMDVLENTKKPTTIEDCHLIIDGLLINSMSLNEQNKMLIKMLDQYKKLNGV